MFLERPYPVVGEPIEMNVHVTVIRSGAPITEGSLGVEVNSANGETTRFSVETPARAGIFIPEITFVRPGTCEARLIVGMPQISDGTETIELPPVNVCASQEDADLGLPAIARECTLAGRTTP